jgi:Uma2 family endonuclease
MASSAIRDPEPMTIKAFLAFADRQNPDEHWELHDGVPRLMVGGSPFHGMIAANIVGAVIGPSRARGCRPFISMLVAVGDYTAYEPDVLLRCGPLERHDRTLADPKVVFEVLSPSTMDFDRGPKFERHKRIDSLEQIVLVYQDSYRVESWLRLDGTWEAETKILTAITASLAIPAIGASLAMSDIYLDVTPPPLA